MKKVGIRKLKNRLGTYVKQVRRGATILITDRGQPVARMIPEPEPRHPKSLDDLLKELAAAGHIRLATRPLPRIKPVPGRGRLASQMVIEDRR